MTGLKITVLVIKPYGLIMVEKLIDKRCIFKKCRPYRVNKNHNYTNENHNYTYTFILFDDTVNKNISGQVMSHLES